MPQRTSGYDDRHPLPVFLVDIMTYYVAPHEGLKSIQSTFKVGHCASPNKTGPPVRRLATLEPSECREGGSRVRLPADHIRFAAAVQFCCLITSREGTAAYSALVKSFGQARPRDREEDVTVDYAFGKRRLGTQTVNKPISLRQDAAV
jgi:hypothetical protein